MITPKEVFEKSNKQFHKVVQSYLEKNNIFPLLIPANKSISGTNHAQLKTAIVPLYQNSIAVKGKGYTIDWQEKNIDGLKQKMPSRIYFTDLANYLHYTKGEDDFNKIIQAFEKLTKCFPNLEGWAKSNTVFLLSQSFQMDDLIKTCLYFANNQPPHNLYLRELPIEVHSKFIEDNILVLKKMLDIILPETWINKSEPNFLNRYYIQTPSVFTQLKILDDDLHTAIGYKEVALTLEDTANLNWQPQKVFIIENKACFLSFPKMKNAIAIFGEGFKSRIFKNIAWLQNAELFCWFDLDAAGFEMLNTIRQYYPAAKSLLMDKKTYDTFSAYSVHSIYRKIELGNLTDYEQELYHFLQTNNKRLEQERITGKYVTKKLDEL